MIIRALVLLACSLVPAWAQTPTPIITLDTTDLELSERAAGKTTIEFTIPAKVHTTGVRLQRWSITQGGKPVDTSDSLIELQGVAEGRPTVRAVFNLLMLNASGSYVATVEFKAPPPPPAPNTATPPNQRSEPREQEQTVQLKLTRPAGELRVSTPLRIERVVSFPSLFVLTPNRITFTEATGKSWVRIDPSPWNVELRHGDAPAERHKLRVWLPSSVNGFGQADAALELDGPVSIGTTTGTLTVRAPQIAAGTVDFAVTLVSRVHILWLALPIGLGIAGGMLLRTRLEARRTRLESLIPAKQEQTALAALIEKTTDETYKGRLRTILKDLTEAMRARRSTPQAITDAAKTATTAREAVMKEMTDLANKLRTDIEAWRRCATVNETLPENVRPKLTALRDTVAAAAAHLEAGHLNAADQAVKRDLAEPVRQLRDALGNWLDSLAQLKAVPANAWPETKLSAELTPITAGHDRIRQALTAAETPDPLWKVLLDVADLMGKIQDRLFRYAGEQVSKVATSISSALLARDRKLKPQADVIDAAVKDIPKPTEAETRGGAEKLVDALAAVHEAVAEGLKTAWDDPQKALPGVAEGRFLDALKELQKKAKPAEQTLGDTQRAPRGPAVTADDVRRSFEGVAEPPARETAVPWTVVLEAPEAMVSQPVMVRAHVIVPDGRAQPELSLNWYLGGEFVGASTPGTFGRPFIFDAPGTAVVEVRATDAAGTRYTARRIITVLRLDDALTMEALEEQLARADRTQNVVSALLVATVGWLIFSPTFTGTFPEFFTAFLWGFFADVGAAKVRELGESMKGLKPTLPLPKTGG